MTECESCGMPMKSIKDHGGSNIENTWCVYCCHKDGTHQTFKEKLKRTEEWLMSEDCAKAGFPKATSKREARARAEALLLMRPYWKKHASVK